MRYILLLKTFNSYFVLDVKYLIVSAMLYLLTWLLYLSAVVSEPDLRLRHLLCL